jgi:hypothetical protein
VLAGAGLEVVVEPEVVLLVVLVVVDVSAGASPQMSHRVRTPCT